MRIRDKQISRRKIKEEEVKKEDKLTLEVEELLKKLDEVLNKVTDEKQNEAS